LFLLFLFSSLEYKKGERFCQETIKRKILSNFWGFFLKKNRGLGLERKDGYI